MFTHKQPLNFQFLSYMKNSRSGLLNFNSHKVFTISVSFLLVAICGTYFLFAGYAATIATSGEAENGALSGKSSIWNDANASNGHAVKFGVNNLAISISGNHLVNAQGKILRLIGINHPADPDCIKATGIFTGPADANSVAQLKNWKINTVRITMNEDCWLGINGVPAAYSGQNYRNAIVSYINMLHAAGMYAIVDLHWNAPGTQQSVTQQIMADKDHALNYWTSVANTFKNDPAVIFEPYNEPDVNTANSQTTNSWDCWLHGCTVNYLYSDFYNGIKTNYQWQTTGMQPIVNAIRATGARNVITLGGLSTSHDLSQLLAYLPTDPLHQEAATFHNYERATLNGNNGCGPTCWNTTILNVASSIPVITDELGDTECQTNYSGYVTQYMDWADQHGISYLPWGWFVYTGDNSCTNTHQYDMLSNLNGTPNYYGQVFYNHFNQLNIGN